MTKVLLIGNGAREHAIATALSQSEVEIHAHMERKNPGIAKLSKEITIKMFLPKRSCTRPNVKVKIQLSTLNNKIGGSLPLLPGRFTRSSPATQSAPFAFC